MEARGETAGERKTVTALFADMAGSTALIHDLDPEVAHRLIKPVVALMMEAVHYYEGYVAKSLGDGILALTLWFQGYPDEARKRSCEALALAQKLAYGPTLAFSLTYAAQLHQLRRESSLAGERAQAVITVSTEHGLPYWLAWGTLLRGWSMSAQGNIEEGIAQMRPGLDAQRAAGGEDQRPYFLALLADSYWRTGDSEARRGHVDRREVGRTLLRGRVVPAQGKLLDGCDEQRRSCADVR
jgi:hypothetical protein